MKNKSISLKTMLLFVLIAFSLIIISTISFTTNVILKNEFIDYIDKSHEIQIEEILETISKNSEDSEFLKEYNSNLVQQGFIIELYRNDNLVYDGFETNSIEIKNLSVEYKEQEELTYKYFDSQYVVFEEKTAINNIDYSIYIYNYRPMYISDMGFKHLESLNTTIIAVSLVILGLAIILAIILANLITKPVDRLMYDLKNTNTIQTKTKFKINSRVKEFIQLQSEINNLNTSLFQQRKFRKNVSADISHELRTPLTAMLLTLENVEEGIWEMDSKIVSSLLEEVKHVQTLVDDIHKIDQIKVNMYKLDIQEINIKEIIDSKINVFSALIESKNLTVNTKYEKNIIKADKKRMEQVIINLLSNAIKYTNLDGKINIKVSGDNNSTVISIKDNGIGICKENQEKVFTRFYRTNTSNEEGNGVGLSIVKEIVEAHDGEILLFSELGFGTEIILILK